MRIDIITVLPELLRSPFDESIIRRARQKGIAEINIINLRDYSTDKHKSTDDYPFGGGAGMVMMVEPLDLCISELKDQHVYDEIIYLTPDGETLNPDGKALLCTLANGQYVGGSFKCAPRAKTDDGLIEVCLVKTISRFRFVKLLGPYTKGEHLDRDDFKDIIVYRQAKQVEVIAEPGFAYSLDGEIIYSDHFFVKMVPGALNFAVPE